MDYQEYSKVPQYTLDSIERYVVHGIPTGDFLFGVLSNDLRKTMWHGDDENLDALRHIFMYVYNRIPSDCWGSPEKVRAWIKERNENGPLDEARNVIRLVG